MDAGTRGLRAGCAHQDTWVAINPISAEDLGEQAKAGMVWESWTADLEQGSKVLSVQPWCLGTASGSPCLSLKISSMSASGHAGRQPQPLGFLPSTFQLG